LSKTSDSVAEENLGFKSVAELALAFGIAGNAAATRRFLFTAVLLIFWGLDGWDFICPRLPLYK
jgi:hypothetical protein